jgi:hypothetical protein
MFTTIVAASIIAQEAKFLPTPTLFVEGLAIATYKNKTWAPISGEMKAGLPFKAYRLDLVRTASLTSIHELEYSDGVEGNFLPGYYGSDVVWSGPKPKYPRSIRTGNPDQSDYNVLVKDFVRSQIKGEPDFKIEINTIIRCDLDGDGKEEVLIEASHQGMSDEYSFDAKKTGSMSCTILRHIKNGKAVTEPIFFFHSPAGPEQEPIQNTHLKAIADLNGDGNLEVVISANYYEGQSAQVFNLVKGQFKLLVENGAGA